MDAGDVFWTVVQRLLTALVVYGAFLFGFHMTKGHTSKWRSALTVLGCVALLSWLYCSTYGTHIEDADPLFGGGERVADFDPTTKQRVAVGAQTFLTLLVPALFGVYRGTPKHRDTSPG